MRAKFTVDAKQFIDTVNRVQEESKRSTDDMLKYVMTLMLRSAHNATPLGRKNRALIKRPNDPEPNTDTEVVPVGKGVRFYRIHKQGSAPKKIFVPSIPRKKKNNESERAAAMAARDAIVAKFKAIKYRGVAKASWRWAISMIQGGANIGDRAEALAGQMRRNPIDVNKAILPTVSYLEVTNKLGWISKITPNVEAVMLQSAYNQMQKWLERRWASGIARAQKGGAQ